MKKNSNVVQESSTINQDSRRIHPTALLVVKERTHSKASAVVKRVLARELESLPLSLGNSQIGKVTGLLVDTRFNAINKVVTEKAEHLGEFNILELASGYSFRVFEQLPARETIVTDLPSSISDVRNVFHQISSENSELRPNSEVGFVGVDVLTDQLNEKVHFKSERPMAIITEGLIPYLNQSQLETLTIKIRDLLLRNKSGGIWVATDLIFTHVLRALNGDKVIDKVSQSTGTNLNKNSFDSLVEFVVFMNRLGMKVEARKLNEDKNYNQFESYRILSSRENKDDLNFIEGILSELHILTITPFSKSKE